MIVAHLSDLHLGYRAFDRTDGGRNVREKDVELAFERALREVLALGPGLIVVSGDVFDRPDPPASAVVALAEGLASVRAALPAVPVVLIAGSSDMPLRGGGPGPLAAFDTIPGTHAAHAHAEKLYFHDGALHVLLVPQRALLDPDAPELRPDPGARWNVLVMRARVSGRERRTDQRDGHFEEGSPMAAVDPIPFDAAGWDYVALGYRHGHRIVAARVAYAGSLERIGPDPWREAAEEKGFLVAELDSGEIRFIRIAGRPVVELARIRIRPGDPRHTAQRIREVVGETAGGIEGKIVRMRLEGQPGGGPPRLDEDLLEDLRNRALHLSVRVDWPAPEGPSATLDQKLEGGSTSEIDPSLLRLIGAAVPEAVQ